MSRRVPLVDPAAIDAIERTLRSLVQPDSIVEIRALGIPGRGKPYNAAGYFDDLRTAAEEAARVDSERKPAGIYFTLNPPHDSLIARAPNQIVDYLEHVTADKEIKRRRLLYLDYDVDKFANISATEAEHHAARQLCEETEHLLCHQYGFPRPAIGDSGNGYVGLLRLDLPNDDESAQLLRRFLEAIQHMTRGVFTDPTMPRAQIDAKTFNASRIGRLFATWNRKGFSTPNRPHRLSSLGELPEPFEVVTREQLEAIAALAPEPEQPPRRVSSNGHDFARLHVDRYLDARGMRFKTKQLRDGRTAFILEQCPFDETHGGSGEVAVFQSGDGKLGFECKHNSCHGRRWQDFKEKVGAPDQGHYDRPPSHNSNRKAHHGDPPHDEREAPPDDGNYEAIRVQRQTVSEAEPCDKPTITPISIEDLVRDCPTLRPPLTHGLLRESEVGNIIGAPKIGKSWMMYSYALSVATGREWLGQFPCERRKVLFIDNELHRQTLAHRIPRVAEAMGLEPADYNGQLELVSLRGKSYDLPAIVNSIIARIEYDTYALVCLDAWYRALPEGVSENDNAQVMRLYNCIDEACETQGCSWANVHHASKGSQSEKSVTDIGAGAGAQSRAADLHMVMRPHEEPGVFVMEAAVRSFAPVEPLPLRWEFPLWVPAAGVDPALLKGRQSRQQERKLEEDRKAGNLIVDFLRKASTPQATKRIKAEAGMGLDRCERILAALARNGDINGEMRMVKGRECQFWSLPEGETV